MPRAKKESRFRHSKKAKAAWERSRESRARGELIVNPNPNPSLNPNPNLPSSLARLSIAAPPEEHPEDLSIGLNDVVEVMGDEANSAAAWLEATVVRVDKPNGLYCVARASSGGTFYVGLSLLRLVAKAGRRVATTCAADAAFLENIKTWSDEKLRTMQDCLGEHDQALVSVVRLQRNADQQWGAIVARKRKLAEEWAAAAPARAAHNKRKRERERAARACAPPVTRASLSRPAYVVSPTRTLPRDPMAPWATRGRVHLHGLPWSGAARALLEAASSDSESEVDDFWSDQGSVDELAAFGVVVGMALAPTIPDFDTYIDGRPGCYFIKNLVR